MISHLHIHETHAFTRTNPRFLYNQGKYALHFIFDRNFHIWNWKRMDQKTVWKRTAGLIQKLASLLSINWEKQKERWILLKVDRKRETHVSYNSLSAFFFELKILFLTKLTSIWCGNLDQTSSLRFFLTLLRKNDVVDSFFRCGNVYSESYK